METASDSSVDSNREKEYQSTHSQRGNADERGSCTLLTVELTASVWTHWTCPRGGGQGFRVKWEGGRPDLENQKLAFEHLSLFLTKVVLSRLPTSRSGNLKNHRLPASRIHFEALWPRGPSRETQHPGTSCAGRILIALLVSLAGDVARGSLSLGRITRARAAFQMH